MEHDRDALAVAGERLVDGVLDDLEHEVVEPGRIGRPDVHRRAAGGSLRVPERTSMLEAS